MDEIKDLMNKKAADGEEQQPAPPPTERKKSTYEIKAAGRRRRQRILIAAIAVVALVLAAAAGFGVVRYNAAHKPKIAAGKTGGQVKTPLKDIDLKPNHVMVVRLGIDEPVFDDTEPGPLKQDDLLKGATYYDENTNKLGTGNAVIFGHSAVSSTHGAPFGKIGDGDLKVGDQILVTDSAKKIYTYVVKEINTIEATDFSVVRPRGEDEPAILTIITCIAPDYPRDKRLAVVAAYKK